MDAEIAEKLVLVLFGWLLGLLAPVIIEMNKQHRDKLVVRKAIRAELDEVGYKLALGAYLIERRQGTLTRQSLEWFKRQAERYNGVLDVAPIRKIADSLLPLPDEELQRAVRALTAEPSKADMLQKYAAPLLDARIATLLTFETATQRQLFEIRSGIALLDELVDRSRYYFSLTFSKLEGDNYSVVIGNLDQVYAEYGKRARRVADQIAEIDRLL